MYDDDDDDEPTFGTYFKFVLKCIGWCAVAYVAIGSFFYLFF